jgi:Domain of unknown function (DUF4232)
MNDDLRTLADVMRERAAEVPHLQTAPPTMLARARRSVVRTALVSVAAAVLVAVAVTVGVASLRSPQAEVPGHSSAPVPAPSDESCIAAELGATASLQGAAGSVEGSIRFTNLGDRTCTLEGRPTISLATSAGRELSPTVRNDAPMWKADDAPEPDGWPVVRLSPGSVASVRVEWSNACPQLSEPSLWTVDLTGGRGALDVVGADAAPSCLGAGEGSTLGVGPFEPGGGQ